MRVADRSATRTYLSQLNSAKNDFMKTQEQIFTGNRFTKISDDVAAGVRVMNNRYNLYTTQTQLENVASVNDNLTLAEDSLMSIEDILTSAYELTLTSLNGTNTDSKEVLATEVAALKEQLLLFANAKVGSNFTFGGTNSSSTEPFTIDDDGNFCYNGIDVNKIMLASDDSVEGIAEGSYYYLDDEGTATTIPMDEAIYIDVGLGITLHESQVKTSSAIQISFSGLDIFGFGSNEDGLSNNLYNILTQIEESILNEDVDALSAGSLHLQDLSDKFLTHITDIGSKTKYLDTIESRLERNVDMYKVSIDNLMGTNDEEAITTLAMNEYVLKAVQQMGSRILPNTLMDFI